MNIPLEIKTVFDLCLARKNVLHAEHDNYRKWCRYYLGFCKKYRFNESKKESLPNFIKKLQEKHQSPNQQNQASHAVNLYYSLFRLIPKHYPSDFDFNDLKNSVKENNRAYKIKDHRIGSNRQSKKQCSF